MKNILCFGDSNTFGKDTKGNRLSRNLRWTGRAQQLLGEDYYLIEDGLSGRTTIWDDPLKPGRCGLITLPISLLTHWPLDLIIISLGTNDVKRYFSASPQDIADGLEQLVQLIQKTPKISSGKKPPEILVFAPAPVGELISRSHSLEYDTPARSKSLELAPLFQQVAQVRNCHFVSGGDFATVGADQLHLDQEGHSKIAEVIAEKIRGILG